MEPFSSPVSVSCSDQAVCFVTIGICALRRNPLAQMEDEKREHENKMKKMEAEMEQVFKMKVSEKKQKLKDSESDVSFQTIEIQIDEI
jgi:hypothetical protein